MNLDRSVALTAVKVKLLLMNDGKKGMQHLPDVFANNVLSQSDFLFHFSFSPCVSPLIMFSCFLSS